MADNTTQTTNEAKTKPRKPNLDEISDQDLADELNSRMANAGERRFRGLVLYAEDALPIEDYSALDEAAARLQRREYREALHYLAIALGREFDRLEDITPENLK